MRSGKLGALSQLAITLEDEMIGGRPSVRFRRLTVVTAITTYLLIVWGGVVRVSGSGEGCGPSSGGSNTWPLCYGHFWPPANQAGYIEFIHRWIAAVAEGLVLVLAV